MASLDDLAAEVFTIIAELVKADGSSLAPLAATSKKCQKRVEQITFRELYASDLTLPKLSRIVHDSRFSSLRHLTYVNRIHRKKCMARGVLSPIRIPNRKSRLKP